MSLAKLYSSVGEYSRAIILLEKERERMKRRKLSERAQDSHYGKLYVELNHNIAEYTDENAKAFANDTVLYGLFQKKRSVIDDYLNGGVSLTDPRICKELTEIIDYISPIKKCLCQVFIDEMFAIRTSFIQHTKVVSGFDRKPAVVNILDSQILKNTGWAQLIDSLGALSAQGKVILWGLGTDFSSMLLMSPLLEKNVENGNVIFVDKETAGKSMFGKEVFPIEKLQFFEAPIILTPRNRLTRANMISTAKQMGISEECLIDFYVLGE